MAINNDPKGPRFFTQSDDKKSTKTPKISSKTESTTLELTGKFGPGGLMNSLFGGKNKDNNVAFSGKAKVVKNDKGTASKIQPLKQGNELIDMLMKIYSFMNKNYEEDKLHKELLENFKEEQKIEDDKRHQKLLKALQDLTKNINGTPSAEKEDLVDGGGDTISNLLSFFGLGKTSLLLLRTVGALLINPVTLALLSAAAAGTVGYWMYNRIKEDPQAALEGKTGVGMAVAGLGSEGQLPSFEEEQKNKTLETKAAEVDKKGLKNSTLPELEAKKQLLVEYGKAKSPEVAELTKEIESRKQTQPVAPTQSSPITTTPTASPEPAASAVSVTPSSAKLDVVQSENNKAKMEELTSPSTSTINNVTAQSSSQKSQPYVRTKIPSVRNTEESYQKMIVYSTRVV